MFSKVISELKSVSKVKIFFQKPLPDQRVCNFERSNLGTARALKILRCKFNVKQQQQQKQQQTNKQTNKQKRL